MNASLKSRKLGKGLSTLIPNKNVIKQENNDQEQQISSLYINDIFPNPKQPRKNFVNKDILELAESIQIYGLLQPIIVEEISEGKYQLISGERRWRACKYAEIKKIEAIIKKSDQCKTLEISIVENIQRCNLNVVEEAYAYQRLIEEFEYSHDKIAQRVNKSRSHISNLIRILSLSKKILSYLETEKITMGHARALINYPQKDSLVEIIIANNLSVRETEKLIKKDNKEDIQNIKSQVERIPKDNTRIKLENTISEKIGMVVKIDQKKKHGNLIIEFNDLNQLEMLVKKLT